MDTEQADTELPNFEKIRDEEIVYCAFVERMESLGSLTTRP